MKTIIAGSRNLSGFKIVSEAVRLSGFQISEVVSGKAPGIDRDGEKWAQFYGIPIKPFPAKWNDLSNRDKVIRINAQGQKYDARAGSRRNKHMAKYADALVAIWDGKSKGTRDMISWAKKYLKPENIFIHRTDKSKASNEKPSRPIKIIRDGELFKQIHEPVMTGPRGASKPVEGAPF